MARIENSHSQAAQRQPPQPRKQPRQARSLATVEAILEAAARVLAERGYAATNTNLVAERAGVSVGSLYQYFPNKDSLITALHERHAAQMYAAIAAVLAAERPQGLQGHVQAMVRRCWRRIGSSPICTGCWKRNSLLRRAARAKRGGRRHLPPGAPAPGAAPQSARPPRSGPGHLDAAADHGVPGACRRHRSACHVHPQALEDGIVQVLMGYLRAPALG